MSKTLIFSIYLMFFSACVDTDAKGDSDANDSQDSNATKTTIIQPEANIIKPVVNVFIENSGSIDGYVNGVTEFEQAVYNYLSDIKISGVSDSLNLFYINSQVIPQGSDIADFIQKLEPSTFAKRGGSRKSSDIAVVLDSVLKQTSKDKISILVTDGIFSPGPGKNGSAYLTNQQIGIKVIFSNYLKMNPTASVMVYELQSNFNGTYYNNIDKKIPLNENRPFYIWVIGDLQHLCNLRELNPDYKLKQRSADSLLNVFTMINGIQTVNYVLDPSVGRYKKSRTNTNTTIEDLGKDKRTGKVKFAVNVDFSNLLLNPSYLLDVNNYENTSGYSLEIKTATRAGFTHTLIFTSDRVYVKPVTVKLKVNIPSWIETVNDDNGEFANRGQTFGIKYQLVGVYDAFTFSNKYFTEIKINIK